MKTLFTVIIFALLSFATMPVYSLPVSNTYGSTGANDTHDNVVLDHIIVRLKLEYDNKIVADQLSQNFDMGEGTYTEGMRWWTFKVDVNNSQEIYQLKERLKENSFVETVLVDVYLKRDPIPF
ncbi:hypothetical protein [Photobacterium leiognathi]|uniref:hypothetical protein n=1 Tax=Photobacterium leiognathi TaxID=553611 RepID=UPI00298211CC|nr:hypothetical protein [Photobacterium leiognathi]